jgi:flavin reductase (DIM6/NTAB) family NADH-FMN oxidoreductase RutF
MSKVRTETVVRFYDHYPAVTAIVTVRHQDKSNALAVAWNFPLSVAPPLYGIAISKKRYSHELIVAAKEFAVNFVPLEQAELIAAVGSTSGRDVDKFKRYKIEAERPLKIESPLLIDAYAAYECRLVNTIEAGDHDIFVGEIVAVNYLEDAFDEKGVLKLDKVNPALYLGSEQYTTTSKDSLRRLDREQYGTEYGRIPSAQ